MNNKTKLAAVALIVVLFAGGFYYTPYFAYRWMRSAAEAKDGAKLARYVDFPALKDSIRTAYATRLVSRTGKGPGGSGAARPVGPGDLALFNVEADAMASADGLAVMSKGGGPDSVIETLPSNTNVKATMAYESYYQAVVNVSYLTRQNPAPVGLVFRRDGWFSWKLVAMRLPR